MRRAMEISVKMCYFFKQYLFLNGKPCNRFLSGAEGVGIMDTLP